MIDYKTKLFSDSEPLWWDKQVVEFNGSVFYSYSYIKYLELCNKNNLIKNLSYVIMDNKKTLSLVIIFVEKIHDQLQMSIGEYSIQSPLINNKIDVDQVNFVKGMIKNNINNICKKYQCILARFQVSSLNILANSDIYQNFYYKWGFTDKILKNEWYSFQCKHSFIIDLKRKKEELRSSIRSSYKSCINKTEKNNIELHIINYKNLNLFEEYGRMHNKIKNNKRNSENLLFNLNLIKENKETIFLCMKNKNIIGAIVILHFNNMAYYNSVFVNNNDNFLYPNHYLLWQAIMYFHSNNYNYFHIGDKIDENITNVPQQHINLSFFKSGWGGQEVSWQHAEKTYLI